MALVFDNRASLGGSPGVHAFVAGVSRYPHLEGGDGARAPDTFGMKQLTSAALSAFRVHEWLLARQHNLPAPLATVRLLLAASPEELAAEPALADVDSSCTLDSFRADGSAWRRDAATSREGMTLFYFAGHGVQRSKGDAVLLLEDFGDGQGGTLAKTVNTRNLYYGMAPSRALSEVARTQVYFVDTCRMEPEAFREYEQMETATVWDVAQTGVDDRRAPMYFAAVPGTSARARPAQGTLFCQALIECLGGAAELAEADGVDRWVVTHLSLASKLADRVRELAEDADAIQWIRSDGFGTDAILHYLDGPPSVRVELEVVPAEALDCARVAILDDAGAEARALPKPLNPNPFAAELSAGVYTINATIDPPTPPFVDFRGRPRPLLPLRVKKKIDVRG